MLKVLIADDEKKIGLLIKKLILWDELSMECMDIVQDGEAALRTILKDHPDIVITDIRMPGLSGLELIERVTDELKEDAPHFIVISGYRYFEYARKVIKYGVEDYLLKPIEEDELNNVLRKIRDSIETDEAREEKLDKMTEVIEGSRGTLHHAFLNYLMENDDASGEDKAEAISDVNKNFGLNFKNEIFQAISVKFFRKNSREEGLDAWKEQLELIERKVAELLEAVYKDRTLDMAVAVRKHFSVTAVLNYEQSRRSDMELGTERFIERLREYISDYATCDICVAISDEYSDFSMLQNAVRMTEELQCMTVFGGSKMVFRSLDIKRGARICSEDIINECHKALSHAMEIRDGEKVSYEIATSFHLADEKNAFGSEYYELARGIAGIMAETFFDDPEEQRETREQSFNEICSRRTRQELQDYLQFLFTDLSRKARERKDESRNRPVAVVTKYINSHYAEKITLEDMAEMAGFTATYFSELFRETTGTTFSAYLNNIRMEEAKRLLRDTDEPVYMVAEKTGYKDPKFFSRQFRKSVGVKPADYRKIYY